MKQSKLLVGALFIALTTAPTFGAGEVLFGYENADVDTTFNLAFDGLGINTTSRVLYTRFKLDIDEEAGTAAFTSYDQEIEPLILPLGISTGRLKVRIVNSFGTYDAKTGVVETTDDYQITFENDLSFFGFESPLILPSTSRGTITNRGDGFQELQMDWEGAGQFENADNPSEPFEYTYSCKVNSVITTDESLIPPLPTQQSCAAGVASLFGFATFGAGFAGMKRRVRRRR